MAVNEFPVLLTAKDEEGNKRLLYPITQADCVDGLEELVDEKVSEVKADFTDNTQSDWDQKYPYGIGYIKNRPFGPVDTNLIAQQVTFPVGEVSSLTISDSIRTDYGLTVGTKCDVEWGDYGNKYTSLEAKMVSSISNIPEGWGGDHTYIGNSYLYGLVLGIDCGEDTGEPFFIVYYPPDYGTTYHNEIQIITNDTTSGTIWVKIKTDITVKKLAAEYLPDGTATEDFVREQIAAIEIPEGNVSGETEIYAEQTWTTRYSSNYGAYIHGQDFGEDFPVFPLSLGDECVVVWDGAEYKVTVGDSSSVEADSMFIGNGTSFGLSGNNEPFGIAWTSLGVTFFAFTDTDSTEHTVRIYQKPPITVSWENVTDKPFGGKNIHIFVDHSTVDMSVMFSHDELGVSFVKLSDETLSKDEFIGVAFEASFADGTTASAVVSEADLLFEYNKGFCFQVMGQVPVWTCFEAGEHTVSMNGQSLTVIVPEAGTYVVDFAVAELAYSQMTKNTLKYLDNRYLDFLEGSEGGEREVFAEQELSEFGLDTSSGFYTYVGSGLFSIQEGESYRIIWDGDQFDCVAFRYTYGGYDTIFLGNESVVKGESTEIVEPFVIYFVVVSNYCGFRTNSDSTSHTVGIYQITEDTYKIKEEYIPDSVRLPAATAEDNNKFLRIVDGVPAWVSLTDVSQEGA